MGVVERGASDKREAKTAKDPVIRPGELAKVSDTHLIAELLRDIAAHEEREIERIKKELALIENSTLSIHTRGGKTYFSCRPKKESGSGVAKTEGASQKDVYITGDLERIHLLARRVYLEQTLRMVEQQKRRIQTVFSALDGAIYEQRIMKRLGRYTDAGLDPYRILFTKEQNEWINAAYSPNPFHRENLNFETGGGIVMRSKSEVLLGNALEAIGWPYRSDDLVKIEDGIGAGNQPGGQPFRDTYFADIKAPNLMGGITVHEHLGAFQLEKYGVNALQRLNDYHNYTVEEIPGKPVKDYEFTWSFECDLRTKVGIEKVIRRILMPRFY